MEDTEKAENESISLMFEACEKGDLSTLKMMLESSYSVDTIV